MSTDYFVISLEKKKKIISILLFVIGLIILLSLLTYSSSDNSNLINDTKEISNIAYNTPETQKRINEISNWLGIFGAYISYFLINYIFGIWSLSIPAVIFTFAFYIYQNKELKTAIYFSNVFLIFSIIFSTFFGLIHSKFDVLTSKYLYGNIGEFLGELAKIYIGFAGSLIILITVFIIILIIAFDVKFKFLVRIFKQLLESIKNLFVKIEPVEVKEVSPEEKLQEKIEKIKAVPKPQVAHTQTQKPLEILEEKKLKLPFEDEEEVEVESITKIPDEKFDDGKVSIIFEDDEEMDNSKTEQEANNKPSETIIIGDGQSVNSFSIDKNLNKTHQSSLKISDKPLLEQVDKIDETIDIDGNLNFNTINTQNDNEVFENQDEDLSLLTETNSENDNSELVHKEFIDDKIDDSYEEEVEDEAFENNTINKNVTISSEFVENYSMNVNRNGKLPEQWEEEINYTKPNLNLLANPPANQEVTTREELERNAELLKSKLLKFGISCKIYPKPGPVISMYEIIPDEGVKISKILGLENDIALALAAKGIRIIAPIPGKSAIGVEIPNAKPKTIYAKEVMKELLEPKYKDYKLPIVLGKNINGDIYIDDLAKIPHLLIAGTTGSGKSVGMNMIITSLLYAKHPKELKLAIVDPKKVEMSPYKALSHHFLAVAPDIDQDIVIDAKKAVKLLKALTIEMDIRYDKLSNVGARNIEDYNKKILSNPKYAAKKDYDHHFLPYIVVIIDELADLMITSGKEVEEPITRIAQLARAVGIHLVIATQRPSVNVITGLIKANFSARLSYQVASKIDSRTILDMGGAEQLIGKGDLLYLPGGTPKPIRLQNAFISTEEIENIINFISSQKGFSKKYYLPKIEEERADDIANLIDDLDPMFEEAAKIIVETQQASTSFLQRKLKLGYSRAARIMDQLESTGIIGNAEGGRGRVPLVKNVDELDILLRNYGL